MTPDAITNHFRTRLLAGGYALQDLEHAAVLGRLIEGHRLSFEWGDRGLGR